MPRLPLLLSLLSLSILLFSCQSSPSVKDWTALVPDESPVVWTDTGRSLDDYLKSKEASALLEFNHAAYQALGKATLLTYIPHKLRGVSAITVNATEWEPVFIIESDADLAFILHQKNEPQTGIKGYSHHNVKIWKLNLTADVEAYCTQIGTFTLLASSSLAIEKSLDALDQPHNMGSVSAERATYSIRATEWEQILKQNLKVTYRPKLTDAFNGLDKAFLPYKTDSTATQNLPINLQFDVSKQEESNFVQAISYENTPLLLDEYIPVNAAHFSIFRNQARFSEQSLSSSATKLDSLLMFDDVMRDKIIESLGIEFGLITFDESGLQEQGEHLWLRKLEQAEAFYNLLERLARRGIVRKQDELFYFNSSILSNILTGGLSSDTGYYLAIEYNVAVLSERIGLCKSVGSDRSRRRVFKYDAFWKEERANLPQNFSSLHFVNSRKTQSYLQEYVRPAFYLKPIFSKFNKAIAHTSLKNMEGEGDASLHFSMQFFEGQDNYVPYEENWLFPLFDEALTGPIVHANMGGSEREELIFSTDAGNVFIVASDGTLVRQMQTENGDKPVGGPVVVDWYGNGLQCVLLAAGKNIYAWDNQGKLLPRFPIEMTESIVQPLQVLDVDLNSSLDLLVATNDRSLHLLDAKGDPLRGWPVNLNASVTAEPRVANWDGKRGVFVVARNVIHAINVNGSNRAGFPVFLTSDLATPILTTPKHLLVGDQSGAISSIGKSDFFTGSYFGEKIQLSRILSDSLIVSRLSFGSTALIGEMMLTDLSIYQTSTKSMVATERILAQSFSGQIYHIAKSGNISATYQLGEFTSTSSSPQVVDLYSDNNPKILALSSYGRLQGWDAKTGRRLISLPGNSMQYPLLIDLNKDGTYELIANASEGLRSWNLLE